MLRPSTIFPKSSRHRPVLLAHRGAAVSASEALRTLVPENSRAAFDWAVQSGIVDGLETDVQATSDGVAVISHDPVFYACEGEIPIGQVTWSELQTHRLSNGEPPLPFAEFLDRYPDIYVNIDAKTDEVVAPALKVLENRSDLGRVALGSFSSGRVWRLARTLGPVCGFLPGGRDIARVLGGATAGLIRPGNYRVDPLTLPTGLLKSTGMEPEQTEAITENARRAMEGLAEKRHLEHLYRWGVAPRLIRDYHCALAVPETIRGIRVVTERFVAAAHTLGCPVYVWTVNDSEQYRRLAALGVDGIYTDIVSTLSALNS